MRSVKVCPKCKGNVFVEWDYIDGEWYEYCLQCSYRHYLPALMKEEPKKIAVESIKKRKRRKNGRQ